MTPPPSLTPMMRQYSRAKAEHPDALVLFRLGDFYEMFQEDAQVGARVLELVLTAREAGKGNRVPMCGVPVHAVETYIARLLQAGYKVAVCEQMEDPRLVRGLVRREVIRVEREDRLCRIAIRARLESVLGAEREQRRDLGQHVSRGARVHPRKLMSCHSERASAGSPPKVGR